MTKNDSMYTDEQLVYSARARCKCGAGLAYPKNASPGTGCWDCSAILKGEAVEKAEHCEPYPFIFYEIKSENQPSASGSTTRPSGIVPPRQKPKGLEVTVSVKDTELFKDVLQILKDVIGDDAIPYSVRQKYSNEISNLTTGGQQTSTAMSADVVATSTTEGLYPRTAEEFAYKSKMDSLINQQNMLNDRIISCYSMTPIPYSQIQSLEQQALNLQVQVLQTYQTAPVTIRNTQVEIDSIRRIIDHNIEYMNFRTFG